MGYVKPYNSVDHVTQDNNSKSCNALLQLTITGYYLASSILQFDYGSTADAVCMHAKLGQHHGVKNL